MLFLALLAARPAPAGELEFQRQTLTMPTNPAVFQSWDFEDIDGDGRMDLVTLDLGQNQLWFYRQTADGFPPLPQQTLQLPSRTAGAALVRLEPGSDPALVVSSASGLACFRQSGGVFETQPRDLIQASQVFTNIQPAFKVTPSEATNGANLMLPIIAADHAVWYHQDGASHWQAGESLPLQLRHGVLRAGESGWTTASQPAHQVNLVAVYGGGTTNAPAKKPDDETINQIRHDIERATGRWHAAQRVDVDGDGREDLVIWGCVGYLDTRTDLAIYLRGADNRLPKQPTQVLRCAGFPIRVGTNQVDSPLCDLNGDGRPELVLVRLKTALTSSSGIVQSLTSKGMDWALSIRAFKNGAFPNRPDASLDFTTMLPPLSGPREFILLDGDFNGDGRPDLLVRRSLSQWQIFLSSTNGAWFEPQPGLTFEVPDGEFIIRDVNGDGRSDLIVQPWNEPRLVVFLSQGRPRLHH